MAGRGRDPGANTALPDGVEVEVRRSARRRRTVAAYRDGTKIIVMIPARFSRAQEAEWVAAMVARLDSGSRPGRRRTASDAALMRRARELSDLYLDGRAVPVSVRWVATMRTRWASCTPADRTIRMSAMLRDMPAWVQDYVLVHELAHLLVAGHDDAFWRLVGRYPRTERARGYLDGVTAAAELRIADDLADDLAGGDDNFVAGTDGTIATSDGNIVATSDGDGDGDLHAQSVDAVLDPGGVSAVPPVA
jgi:predicted metal-dependent hydrolase